MDVWKVEGRTKPSLIFGDPPDNIGLDYNGFTDKWASTGEYLSWLKDISNQAMDLSDKVALSINPRWLPYQQIGTLARQKFRNCRILIWKFTFGSYSGRELTYSYRPILFIGRGWHPEAVLTQSVRHISGDKRSASPDGRKVSDDVLEFPRVVGNSSERRSWHPTQHPEELYQWILRYGLGNPVEWASTPTVIDLFAGSGTCYRAWGNLPIDVVGCEASEYYTDCLLSEHSELERWFV